MRNRAGLAVLLAAVVAVPVVAVQPGAASARAPRAGAPTAADAGNALAAATTVEAAKAAMVTILTNSGIALSDGTGAPADQAVLTVPAWEIDGLAAQQIAGANMTLAQNAKVFDKMLRWAGTSAISAPTFSTMLAAWFNNPADEHEAYFLGALEQFGLQTVPPVDLKAGAAVDAPLPFLLVVAEEAALLAPGAPQSTVFPLSFVARPAPSANPCEIIGSGKDGYTKLTKFYTDLDAAGRTFGAPDWETIATHIEALGVEAGEVTETVAEDFANIIGLLNGVLQAAAGQGLLDVTITQDPQPVIAHEKGANPNPAKIKIVVKAKNNSPKEAIDCLKLVIPGGVGGIDVPEAGKPIAKAQVTINPGDHFTELLSIDYSGDQARTANGFGGNTDASGTYTQSVLTLPQKLAPGVGKDMLRQGTISVEVAIQPAGFSPSAIVAAIFDHISPWSTDFGISVRRREQPALTISGNFSLKSFVEVTGSLNIRSCSGFDGHFLGTLNIAGGIGGDFAAAAAAITGLPATGSGAPAVNAYFPEQDRGTNPLSVGVPELGVITPLVGKLGLKFIDETTALLTIDGTALVDPSSGNTFKVLVTPGGDGCPGS